MTELLLGNEFMVGELVGCDQRLHRVTEQERALAVVEPDVNYLTAWSLTPRGGSRGLPGVTNATANLSGRDLSDPQRSQGSSSSASRLAPLPTARLETQRPWYSVGSEPDRLMGGRHVDSGVAERGLGGKTQRRSPSIVGYVLMVVGRGRSRPWLSGRR